jgi:multicomponent Na+:H+ antiporter subunit E
VAVTRIIQPVAAGQSCPVRVTTIQGTDVRLAVHANSITLTPGTVTVDARRGEFLVHALTADGGADLAHGAIDQRVAAMEGAA